MKKLVGLFVALFVCSVMISPVLATDFVGPEVFTASMTFSTGKLEFSVKLYNWNKNYDNSSEATKITWDVSDIQLGKDITQFKCANVYALIESTITTLGSKVYLYQDNQNNEEDYRVTTSSRQYNGTWLKSGLVNSRDKSVNTTLNYKCVKLSECRDASDHPEYQSLPYFAEDGTDVQKFAMRYFADKGDSDWDSKKGTDIVTIAKETGVWAGDDWPFTYDPPIVMFFGATFSKKIFAGESYGTTSINFTLSAE